MPSHTKGVIYGVRNLDTGKIEKVGSTVQSLVARARGYRQDYPWFREGNYELRVLRHVEHEDDPTFFVYLLRATEGLEIGRRQTWIDQGGRNVLSPATQFLSSLERQQEVSVACGLANVANGHLARISKKGGVASAARGHLQRWTQEFGAANQRQMQTEGKGLYGLTAEERRAIAQENIRRGVGIYSPNYDRAAVGRRAANNKTGIHAVDFDRIKSGQKGGQVNVETGHIRALGKRYGSANGTINGALNGRKQYEAKTGLFAPENAGRANHAKWHTKRADYKVITCIHCRADIRECMLRLGWKPRKRAA